MAGERIAQRKVEAYNFDLRKNLLEISDDLQRWNIASDPRIGTGGTLTNTIPALLGQGGYYFRVRVQP